jgi:hypothetical protein
MLKTLGQSRPASQAAKGGEEEFRKVEMACNLLQKGRLRLNARESHG